MAFNIDDINNSILEGDAANAFSNTNNAPETTPRVAFISFVKSEKIAGGKVFLENSESVREYTKTDGETFKKVGVNLVIADESGMRRKAFFMHFTKALVDANVDRDAIVSNMDNFECFKEVFPSGRVSYRLDFPESRATSDAIELAI